MLNETIEAIETGSITRDARRARDGTAGLLRTCALVITIGTSLSPLAHAQNAGASRDARPTPSRSRTMTVTNTVHDEARAGFSESELVALTMVIIAINGWTRLAVSFRTVPGSYQPRGAADHGSIPTYNGIAASRSPISGSTRPEPLTSEGR
jgi:hypothetical protein